MDQISQIRDSFIDRMARIAQAEGVPPIAGRVYALMLFDGGPIAFGDLAERLGVSRASISTSVRLLEGQGMINRVRIAGQRGDFFAFPDAPVSAVLSGMVERCQRAEQAIRETLDLLPETADAARQRLSELADFHSVFQDIVHEAQDRTRLAQQDYHHD